MKRFYNLRKNCQGDMVTKEANFSYKISHLFSFNHLKEMWHECFHYNRFHSNIIRRNVDQLLTAEYLQNINYVNYSNSLVVFKLLCSRK